MRVRGYDMYVGFDRCSHVDVVGLPRGPHAESDSYASSREGERVV